MPTVSELLTYLSAFKDVTISLGAMKLNLYVVLKGLIAIFALLWMARMVVGFAERKLIAMRHLRPSNRTLIVKFIQIILYIVVFLTTLQILGISLAAFGVIGGALGVGIGFGLQKIASNFISGIILLFEKSIEVNDLIEMPDGTTGFVRNISARYTRIETADARDIIVPNEDFITKQVISHTHSNSRSRIDIPMLVRHDTDVEQALRLLLEATLKIERCLRTPEPMAHVTAITENGITLMLYFWIDNVTQGRLEPRTQAYLTILQLFRIHEVHLAAPKKEPAQ